MNPWLASHPPVAATVGCGTERHVLRWEAGDIVALDHQDIDGERALAALGGEASGCIAFIDAWTRRHADPSLLVTLPRGATDPLETRGNRTQGGYPLSSGRRRPRVQAGSTRMVAGSLYAGNPTPQRGDIALLLQLGPAMARRMVATVTAALLANDAADQPHLPALTASLFGRATNALRQWTGQPDLVVELAIADHGVPAEIGWVNELVLGATLPLSWVISVWGANLDNLADRFVLDAIAHGPSHLALFTVDGTLGPPTRVTVRYE